jgi:Flp pilus assembly protein TadB
MNSLPFNLLVENLAIAVVGGMGIWLTYRSLTIPRRVRLTRDLEEIEDTPETFVDKIQHRLDQAGFEISAKEFLMVALGLGSAAAVVAFLATGMIAMVPLALVLAPVLYWSQLENKREKRVRAYREALADGVDIIKEAFGVTPNVQFGIKAVAEDGPPELQEDFREILTLLHQGATLEEATDPVAGRRNDQFFDMVREALVLRESEGGSVREVLNSISSLVREQGRIFRRMVTQQTQARMEAMVVCLAPIALFMLVKATMPEYAGPFYATSTGQLVLVAVAVLDLIAHFLSKKISTSGMELTRVERR